MLIELSATGLMFSMSESRFRPGNWVKVSVTHQFKGYKLGVVESLTRDGHPYVRLLDPNLITKTCIVDTERGDTIVKITKS